MSSLKPSHELKSNARGYLLGKYTQVVPVQIIYGLAAGSLSMVGSNLSNSKLLIMSLIGLLITLLASVLSLLLHYGLCRMYMNLCCGFRFGASDLFSGFSFKDDRPVRFSLRLTLAFFLSILPAAVVCGFAASFNIKPLLIAASVLLCAGLILFYNYYLELSQCFYLMLDFPDKSLADIMALSRWLMKGRKLRLFYLQVSFVPIYLLGWIPCGIGLFWANPYIETTLACFHLNLTSAASEG
ncbi:MAG: DUF975 family protein [Lachnospiraceae bacterium]|nr:DUF975 family protein [Lachnospiraceae bacterium]